MCFFINLRHTYSYAHPRTLDFFLLYLSGNLTKSDPILVYIFEIAYNQLLVIDLQNYQNLKNGDVLFVYRNEFVDGCSKSYSA